MVLWLILYDILQALIKSIKEVEEILMKELVNTLIGNNIELSNDMYAMICLLMFIFIVTISVDIIDMLRGMGGK